MNNDTPGTDDGLALLDQVFATGHRQRRQGQGRPARRLPGRQRQRRGHVAAPPLRAHPPRRHGRQPVDEPSPGQGPPRRDPLLLRHQPEGARPDPRSGAGYYVLGSDGGIFSFGDAPFLGSRARPEPRRQGHGAAAVVDEDGCRLPHPRRRRRHLHVRRRPVPGLACPGSRLRGQGAGARPPADGVGQGLLDPRRRRRRVPFGDADFYGSVPGLGITSRQGAAARSDADGQGLLGARRGRRRVLVRRRRLLRLRSRARHRLQGRGDGARSGEGGEDDRLLGAVATTVACSPSACRSTDRSRAPASAPGRRACRWRRPGPATATGSSGEDGGVFGFGDAARYGDVTGLGLKIRAVDLGVVPAPATAAR